MAPERELHEGGARVWHGPDVALPCRLAGARVVVHRPHVFPRIRHVIAVGRARDCTTFFIDVREEVAGPASVAADFATLVCFFKSIVVLQSGVTFVVRRLKPPRPPVSPLFDGIRAS